MAQERGTGVCGRSGAEVGTGARPPGGFGRVVCLSEVTTYPQDDRVCGVAFGERHVPTRVCPGFCGWPRCTIGPPGSFMATTKSHDRCCPRAGTDPFSKSSSRWRLVQRRPPPWQTGRRGSATPYRRGSTTEVGISLVHCWRGQRAKRSTTEYALNTRRCCGE